MGGLATLAGKSSMLDRRFRSEWIEGSAVGHFIDFTE
jgi:hypothetical protein